MMKSQADMDQLNEKIQYTQKVKTRIGYTEEVNHPRKDLKRIKDLLAITMVS